MCASILNRARPRRGPWLGHDHLAARPRRHYDRVGAKAARHRPARGLVAVPLGRRSPQLDAAGAFATMTPQPPGPAELAVITTAEVYATEGCSS